MISIVDEKTRSLDKELRWLVSQIITPEFPQLLEALQICSNLLLYNTPQHPDASKHIERGPPITLPFSSGKSDEFSGIIVRDGTYITKMSASVREKHFNRVINRLSLRKPYLLSQVLTAKSSIDAAVELIVQAMSIFDHEPSVCEDQKESLEDHKEVQEDYKESLEDHRESSEGYGEDHKEEGIREDAEKDMNISCGAESHKQLVEVFQELLKELQKAKSSLQLPTDPNLVFPQHVTSESMFEPDLSGSIAVDIYLSSAEICIDIKDLTRIVEKPWCEIDLASGKSYVDNLRDQMSRGKDMNVEKDEGGVFSSVLGHLSLKPRYDTQDYITRCVTYNNSVVMVNKKLEVSSADPVLVSAFTKLDSVEYMVSSFLENITKLSRSIK